LATLDELLEMEGVVAALEFAPDGQLVDYRAEMDLGAEAAELAGTFCAATTMMFNGLVTALTPRDSDGLDAPARVGVCGRSLDDSHWPPESCLHRH